jgi:glycosyltransferase involved in cell wall biosynthesis
MGGAELQQTLIARCLARAGYEVSFLVHDHGQPEFERNPDGITLVNTFPADDVMPSSQQSFHMYLFRGMRKARADIYYQRSGSIVTGLAAAYCKLIRRRFIYAAASQGDVDGTKEHRHGRLKGALYRYGVRHADIALVQTEWQKGILEERYGRTATLIRNIYETPEPIQSERRYVLWVGSFYPLKRPELFLDIARKMPDQKFVMIGHPRTDKGRSYETSAALADRLPNLEIRPPAPYSQIGRIYSEAQVLVCTFEREGFPNTFLDAWSRRTPVVATVDPDEVICRHNLGFHRNTADELAGAVSNLLLDSELRTVMGENGYRYVKSMHDVSVIGPEYDRLISSLMGGRGSLS